MADRDFAIDVARHFNWINLWYLAARLGEFGATITFVGNVAGETRTLPLAIYSATHQIDGDAMAVRLIMISLAFAFFALLLSNMLSRRAATWLGVNRA